MAETSTSRSSGEINGEAKERIAQRLSSLENLYFPRAVQPRASDSSQRKSIFLDLLSRDIAVFLERYGTQLTSDELQEFDALKGDYEINWHLNHLRTIMSPTSDELRLRSITVKNRRRAYLNKLISDGQYFSEDAMREREPYLHHEYVGKFQDPSGRSMARPGERWSETLMRRSEEAFVVAEIRREQQRLGVAERDWVGNEIKQVEEEEGEVEEEEEEEEEEQEQAANGEHIMKANGSAAPSNHVESAAAGQMEGETLSAMEIQDQLDQFTYIMQQKFLSGEDHQHLDYSKIDEDESLDDHWLREANDDAEDKYFAED
ncbi:coiled-coil domain-containing protein 97 [Rhodamnia argentea]|uniref:Coiled-coil domain-containing protein 97 n=1 Tax=Rhodamnia argentea TaxID=178133 RepID=A0A8B8PG49_9MYRT|nr:coiled-coil domain-containing protein 97 [Rhodamnia argentea]